MLTRFLFLALLLGGSAALAAEPAKGPYLSDLMQQQAYLTAWKVMLRADPVPDWVADYAKTLDGPATPSIDVSVRADTYTLAFTCKAHDCGSNQLWPYLGNTVGWGTRTPRSKPRS